MPWHHERGWSVVGVIPVTRTKAVVPYIQNTTYVFEHSCNTALVVAALNYNIPDSEVSACFPCAARPPPLVAVKRFVAIFTRTNRNFSSGTSTSK